VTTIIQRAFDIDERPLEVTPPKHRHDLATRRRLTGPGLRAFFNVAREWDLSNEEQQALLGWPARATFFKMKKGDVPAVSVDQLERISLVLGIYKALHILFPDEALANQWVKIHNRNPLFAGKRPIQYMTGSIDNLYQVRRLLDGRRG
jgi:antitoxin Xre/MbcA/ParS-like protein